MNLSKYSDGDKAALMWWAAAMIRFPAFTTFGLILAIKFFVPTFLIDFSWLSFGRVRPAHVNGVLFGFLSSALLGGMFYIVPRLCARPLIQPTIAKLTAVLWNSAVLIGVIAIMLGDTQAREYAEMPWIIDVAVMITLGLMAYVVLGTIAKREEPKIYSSLWFFAAVMMIFPIVYFIGNVMWRPPTGALYGVIDSIFNWYYGHNVLGWWFTPLGIGIVYYFVPRMINKPLYSHSLSIISFFSLAFFYTGVGAHHLLQAPLPEWLKTIAVSTSGLMLLSVLSFGVNIGMTMRNAWHNFITNIPFRFIIFGFICYILVSVQGTFQAMRDINLYLHFGQWTVGHAHLALLGAFGFIAVGIMFWGVPKLTGKPIFSEKLMSVTWWLAFSGLIIFMIGMETAGLVQSAAWSTGMTVASTLPLLPPYFIVRAIGGGIVVVAAYVFAVDIIMTFIQKPKTATIEVQKEDGVQ